MAILIFLKGAGGNALVAKDKMEDLEVALSDLTKLEKGVLVLSGFHGGKIVIVNPLDNVTHFLEQADEEVRKNQKKAEERQKAAEREMQGKGSLVDPVSMFPGRKNN